jgi:hypothetical protein
MLHMDRPPSRRVRRCSLIQRIQKQMNNTHTDQDRNVGKTPGHERADDGRWQFWGDGGGTFTGIVARRPDGTLVTHKLRS